MPPRPIAVALATYFVMLLLIAGGCGEAVGPPPKFVQAWGTRGSGPGQFDSPEGMALDRKGNLLVADTWRHRILKFDSSGKQLLAFGAFGNKPGEFKAPRGLAVDRDNNIYVADSWNNRVQKFTEQGKFLMKFGGVANPAAYPAAPQLGLFSYPWGIAVDSKGNIYVSDPSLNRCQMFDPKGKFLLAWGTAGRQDDQFQVPTGLAVDKADVVYVADTNNARVQKFELKGILPPPPLVEAESLTPKTRNGRGQVSKKAMAPAWSGGGALIFRPSRLGGSMEVELEVENAGTYEIFASLDKDSRQGIVALKVDGQPQGRRFDAWTEERVAVERTSFGQKSFSRGKHRFEFEVVDKNSQAKGRELTLDSLQLVSVTKERFLGKWGTEGRDPGEMLRPRGICFDGKDGIYVADTGNHRLQKYTTTGEFLTRWGKQGKSPGEFESPHAVAAGEGSVFVLDWGNNRVEKFGF